MTVTISSNRIAMKNGYEPRKGDVSNNIKLTLTLNGKIGKNKKGRKYLINWIGKFTDCITKLTIS